MASYTSNLNLKKPALTDDALVTDLNDNSDKLDAAISAGSGAIAIVSVGNTHAAISSGQYVYVRQHGSLSEGLYTATTNIAANGTLSGSNLTAVSGGGLNSVYSALSDQMANQLGSLVVKFRGMLTGDVIAVARDASIGIHFFYNSNDPANCPTGCRWGAYLILKGTSTSVTIFYADGSHIACLYALDPTTATSLTWHIA